MSDLDEKILKIIKRKNLNEVEAKTLIDKLTKPNRNRYATKKLDLSDKLVSVGYFTDAHMGSKFYRKDAFDLMSKYFKKIKPDFIVNAGDTLEGMSNREGHVYELDHLGFSNQKRYAREQFKKLEPFKVYSIEAQNSHTCWGHNKSNQGVDAGEEMAKDINNYEFIGYDEQDIVLKNGLKIRLRHPGGGTSYALSYKSQKYIESISGGNKPHVLLEGHYHKFNHIFYRNIQSIMGGCLQDQSPFMKKIGTPAHVGFGVMKIGYNKRKNSIDKFVNEFIPFYE